MRYLKIVGGTLVAVVVIVGAAEFIVPDSLPAHSWFCEASQFRDVSGDNPGLLHCAISCKFQSGEVSGWRSCPEGEGIMCPAIIEPIRSPRCVPFYK